MSLLGKPINYNRGARRDARYRRLQSRVYNFLERPRGLPAILYHVLVFLMVFTCLALSVFCTIDEYEDQAIDILLKMEIIVVIWFTMEFSGRLWSSGCRSRYQGPMGRLKFLKRPFCIIDVVTIGASIVVIGMGTSGQVFATSALRGLRFFQILRMVRMDRRGGTWKLLGSVVYAHRQELITTLYIGFLGLIFSSFAVYLMEKDVNKKFSNFAQALWWGVITLCTVGYGDMVPETWQGKVIASFCALLGISFFALPAGILGSGFALKVQQQQRQKHMIRRRQPAATLIQSLWRCYAADEHSLSIATWKIHQVPLPSPPPSFRGQKIYLLARRYPSASERRASSSFKHNASFVARLPTIRRHKSQSLHSPAGNSKPPTASGRGRMPQRTMAEMNASAENLEVTNNGRPMNPSLSEDSVADTAISKRNSDVDSIAINNCESKFSFLKSATTAVHGQFCRHSSHPSANANAAVATAYSKPALLKIGETTALPIMLYHQWIQVQEPTQTDATDETDDQKMEDASLHISHEDDEPRCVQLTNQHKTAIRFIRKMKYFVARRKFKEALKPYDVKDVMEQYAAGHVDLLGRTRNIQSRLDQILGKQGSKAKDVYASKISLASRVVKVERSVADIEEKLDILIKAYMQDRERLLALPLVPENNSHSTNYKNNPPAPPPPPAPGVAGILTSSTSVPKPILVEKQFSEPNSPITKSFDPSIEQEMQQQQLQQQSKAQESYAEQHSQSQQQQQHRHQSQRRPPMQRGYSDLGNRIKKRVTLSSIPSQYVDNNSIHADGSGDVVIVVPAIGSDDKTESILVSRLPHEHSVCIDPEEADMMEPNSPKTITESSILMVDECEEEEIEENDLDCEGELGDMDVETPPWNFYGDEDIDCDEEIDDQEDTALLRASAAKTEIVITPMSPVSSNVDLARMSAEHSGNGGRHTVSITEASTPLTNIRTMDLLKPEASSSTRLLQPDNM
ncbi:potassium voltage-gated channel subfamily KQT member 5 isoform X2 [Sitodiplosis mosellana]|uniref:potassium voltage-gated channel subfamily KQT member 5 isoform X2 n=1 Tax=Sitodiplosis mosellana TaxID=263140 RepID=UPI002443BEFE|nr:potassium voltage-gated channel subfamily KQT member 5 isoform X2 [Sitodiplosis mosellana]XP_055319192.1 potassium voltage-gated channel subfamily KQT member 5 isoform X2 [Sitodiplosis mosellana]XP_055319193.1 potassium voltage-gated channel subfamily KQT member 5 isoform X2 [Sitodiplosis mosellana]